ncbi:hypothetical protein SISSUDRAFT_975668, partial [Sistotremastrum suecicum HHB10207 ss-3]
PKEPTRQQLSSRLSYQQTVPSFLRAYQNRVAGRASSYDEDEPEVVEEGGVDEFGRDIVRERPRSPTVKDTKNDLGEPSPEHEEQDDEAPVVVVLKEGKHLSAEQAAEERRLAQGLPPSRHKDSSTATSPAEDDRALVAERSKPKERATKPSLSFSSTPPGRLGAPKQKRKLGVLDESETGASDKS